MRTRFSRIAATAAATALLAGFGAFAVAGPASAATTAVAAHHHNSGNNDQCTPGTTCINLDNLLGLHVGIVISPILIGL